MNVNVAGIVPIGRFLTIFADNSRIKGARACASTLMESSLTRAVLARLLEVRATIINVSSVSGIGGDWNMSACNAAKGALTNLTRALALELGEQGVRVNAVCNGLTSTERTSGLVKNSSVYESFQNRIPLGGAAKPEKIAAVIAFLASLGRVVREQREPVRALPRQTVDHTS